MTKCVTWLSKIVLAIKKNGKLHVYIDFSNLNNVTPKDKYPVSMTNMLIDLAARNVILNSIDGHSGYNQIFITEGDVRKIAFRCLRSLGTYKWVVIPFGLKNMGAMCQRAKNFIFHDMIN